MLRFIRFKSISALKEPLLKGEIPVNRLLITQAFKDGDIHELKSLLKNNSHLLTTPTKNELLDFVSQDFSIYYLLKDHDLSASQLANVIAANPERVDTSWELYQRHNIQDEPVFQELIKKLIEDPSESDWARALYVYNKMNNKQTIEELVFDKLVEKKPELLQYFNFSEGLLKSKIKELSGVSYTIIFSKLLGRELDFELYARIFEEYTKVKEDPEFLKSYSSLAKEALEFKVHTLEEIIDYVESQKLDISKVPESILVRVKLMNHYGLQTQNIEKLLEKFHLYQTHTDFGMAVLQNKVAQAYCLKAFEDENSNIFPTVDALLLDSVPINVLQCLILSHSAFGTDKSLEIYNKYIQHVSKTPNEYTGRSAAGLLNELIILAFLYNNDRDFAHIIFDKISQSNLLSEPEVAEIKKVFRVYGDAFVEEDWAVAKPILKKHVANTIRNL